MRRYNANLAVGQGDYTYTSELRDRQGNAGAGQHLTEQLGYFHIGNEFPGSDDRAQWEKSHIRNSNFGRDVWHCVQSSGFMPWSVLERHEVVNGNLDIYLLYACGENFALSGAMLKLECARYGNNDSKEAVEQKFRTVYDKPLTFEGEARQGYQKRKIDSFNLAFIDEPGEYLAFKCTIYAAVDNADGNECNMRDFYIEGFAINEPMGQRVKPKGCIIF